MLNIDQYLTEIDKGAVTAISNIVADDLYTDIYCGLTSPHGKYPIYSINDVIISGIKSPMINGEEGVI